MVYSRKGQQEMVGFVLIVVIVVVGMIVFLLFSLRQDDVIESELANNILSSIMDTTSDCALVYEPDYEDMRDLFKSCYDSKTCSNSGEDACAVLERSLDDMLSEIVSLEPVISAYQLDFYLEGSSGPEESLLHIVEGECKGDVFGSEPHSIRVSGEEKLIVRLKVCIFSLDV